MYINGHYGEWFSIKSGVAQGCPVSPLLFLLVAQALTIAINTAAEAGKIKGIKIGPKRHLLSQFADDTTLLLGTAGSCRPALEVIRRWGLRAGHGHA